MCSPQIDLKSAAIAKALSRMKGIFQNEEAHTAKLHYGTEKDSDLSVYAHFIQENATVSGQMLQVSCTQKLTLSKIAGKRFFDILKRAAKAQEGISRQERLFVQQFWSAMAEPEERMMFRDL